MIINHNMSAQFAQRTLKFSNRNVERKHGGSLFRHAHKPCRRRRLGACRQREDALPDPGTASVARTERPGRNLLHSDNRRLPSGDSGHSAADAGTGSSVFQRHLLQRRPDADPGRSLPAGGRNQPDCLACPVQRHEHAYRALCQPDGREYGYRPQCGSISAPTWISGSGSSSVR